MRIYGTQEELLQACNFTIHGANDRLKADKAWARYVSDVKNGNPGAQGNASEVLSRRPGSRKTRVSGVRESDISFRLDGRLVKAERKTSGGRIDDITLDFVVYSIDLKNSTGDKYISPRIMRTEDFLSALYSLGAVKKINKNGVLSGYGIQVSSRKLWAWLEDQLEFNREWDYYSEDFEG